MSKAISRRRALAVGAAAAGAVAAFPRKSSAEVMPDVWGEDFILQWSPPANVKRDITAGPTPVRLSCEQYRIDNGMGRRFGGGGGAAQVSFGDQVKAVRDNGYTATESHSIDWTEVPDSQVRELQAALKEHDVMFYTLHQWNNIISPDPASNDRTINNILKGLESAERIGVPNQLLHSGARGRSLTAPHEDNWTRETWEMSMAALRRILKESSGFKTNLAIEAINCTFNNTPQSHVQMKKELGDPRVKVCLDPTNMMHPGVFYRSTELINQCFDLLGEDIVITHAKDNSWRSMSAAVNEGAVLGTGNMDNAQYLARLSRLEYPRPMLIEHLRGDDQYKQSRDYMIETAEKIGVKIYS